MAYDDEWSDEQDAFGDLGEFGVTSDELPAVKPWRARWEAEQRERAYRADKIHKLYLQHVLSGPAYDLLQLEFQEGLAPHVEDRGERGWMVWSANEQRWYLLATWERKAQEYLAIDDPERATHVYQTPRIVPLAPPLPDAMGVAAPPTRFVEPPPWQRPQWDVPWGRAADSDLTPPPAPRPRRTPAPAAPTAPAAPAKRRQWWQW